MEAETRDTHEPVDFFGLSRPRLANLIAERFQEPAYRANQLFEWIYKRETTDCSVMNNISRGLRDKLAGTFTFPEAVIEDRRVSIDGTRKYLLRVSGGDTVESVMIKQPTRMTLCVSSQVGCAMGCSFCRTATMGLKRHLSTSEIIQQVRAVLKDAKHFGDTFDNIVFMGMGEPLHNFEGVTEALSILTDHLGFEIGPRKITVSTSGLVPAIKRFGALDLGVQLAVSLNATTDELRNEIMPVNRRHNLSELMHAVREFPLRPKKRVTLEYVMLAGVNDLADDLKRLAQLVRGLKVMVNLIPYNENAGLGYKSPARDWVLHWHDTLNDKGVPTTIRWSKGVDIDAACGQLATASAQKRVNRGSKPPSALPVLDASSAA